MKKFVLLSLLFLCGCTANERARNWGGSVQEDLPKGQKLVNVTWKNDDMWILTRPMKSDDSPEEYSFKCNSSFGIWEGEVIIKESK